ncbi:MAG: hypothetical protein FWF82_02020 [Oscillospiraceae bacterium]|nr:hypothetical protein [Oscillospiraceae bacterium]
MKKMNFKRVISVIISAALMFGLVNIVMPSQAADIGSHQVQVEIRHTGEYPADQWWQAQVGTPISITGNGSYTAEVDVKYAGDPADESFVNLSVVTVAGTPNLPESWDDPKVKIDSVTFNGGTANYAPTGDDANVDLKAYNAAGPTGKVDIALWNAWWEPARLLKGVTIVPAGDNGDPSFTIPGISRVTKVTIKFTVSGLEADAQTTASTSATTPPTTPPPPAGSYPVKLSAQIAAGSWATQSGDAVNVTGNGSYTATLNTTGGTNPFVSLYLEGADSSKNVPSSWDDPKIKIDSVTFNSSSTNYAPTGDKATFDFKEYNDAGATGKAKADLWNAWWEPARILKGVTETFVTTDGGDVPGFMVSGISDITSVTVKFTISNIGGSDGNFKKGHVLGNDNISINDALEILKYLAKLPGTVIESNESAKNAAMITDKSKEDKVVAINDALEVLKYLAKLDSQVEP